MSKRRSISLPRCTLEELCELYENEDHHTLHVTHLALTLFDEVAPVLGMDASDRRLLEAAARLHDVGYAVDPRNHLPKSIAIVREEGLEGFQKRQLPYILAIMSLHQNNTVRVATQPLIKKLSAPRRALRLGAILRIADGLDQSHIQDATITGVRRVGDLLVVTVYSPTSPDNLTRASTKASLWHEVMPIEIRFERTVIRARAPRVPVHRGMNQYEAARRLLYQQFKCMRACETGMRAGEDIEPLHDYRVALRRFRAILRLFRKPLRKTSASDIDQKLAAIGDALGPARDADVWMRTILEIDAQRNLSRSRLWKPYLAFQVEQMGPHLNVVRQVLDGARYRNLMLEMAYYLRIELPRVLRERKPVFADHVAASRVRLAALKIYEAPIPGGAWDVEAFHELRKACRRLRYWAEFYGPVLGPATRRWGRLMKQVADVLGDLHDADMALERLAYEPVSPPGPLKDAFREHRAQALQDIDAVWQHVRDTKRFSALERELKRWMA